MVSFSKQLLQLNTRRFPARSLKNHKFGCGLNWWKNRDLDQFSFKPTFRQSTLNQDTPALKWGTSFLEPAKITERKTQGLIVGTDLDAGGVREGGFPIYQ